MNALLAWIDQGPRETGGAPGAPEVDEVFERDGKQPRRHSVERIANALGAGPHQDKDGGNRIERLRRGLAGVGPDGLYARLVAFERLGAVHPEAAADCARLLGAGAVPASLSADPELHARLLLQALRAVVALGGASVDLADPELLLSNATDPASARELARLLIAGGAGGAQRARVDTLSSHGRFVLFAWLAGKGEIVGAADLVAGIDPLEAGAWLRASGLERGTDLASRVAQAARAAARERGTLAAAEERIQALELHAGVLPEALEPTVVAAAIRAGDLELLARATSGVAGEAARAALLDQLSAALNAPAGQSVDDPGAAAGARLERALGLALRELYASRQDERAGEFVDAVDERVRAARKHPLAAALVEHGWPRLPPLDWVDLDAADRRR
ncbi:MAG: hypothetical protein FJ299_16175 [Planctomycetes bacterium]|nr:hypothetical protein [Planctomycetota bacterium]